MEIMLLIIGLLVGIAVIEGAAALALARTVVRMADKLCGGGIISPGTASLKVIPPRKPKKDDENGENKPKIPNKPR